MKETGLQIYQMIISIGIPLLIFVLTWLGTMFNSMKAEIKKLALEMQWRNGTYDERHKTFEKNYEDHEERLNQHDDDFKDMSKQLNDHENRIKFIEKQK